MKSNALAFLSVFISLVAIGCHSERPPATDQAAHSYFAQGVVEKLAPDLHQVTIHHQAIPGYMMEMTMDFSVNDASELNGLTPGDNVTFTLFVDDDRAWIGHLRRIGHSDLPTTNSTPISSDQPPQLKPGDPLPDGDLLAENGRTIQLSDFKGKALAFTFFFTRCPLPNYCPLMNHNFAQTRQLLLSTPGAPANWQLLSLSFDSAFDRPENLASYAGFYRGKNPDRWLFASTTPATLARLGPAIGLMVMGQDAGISHNLRTVVVDPQGRLYCQFNDNLWTPRQLADAILAAAHAPASK